MVHSMVVETLSTLSVFSTGPALSTLSVFSTGPAKIYAFVLLVAA